MHDLASRIGLGASSRSLGHASACTLLLLAGTLMTGQPAMAGDETAPRADILPADAELTEAEKTAKAYLAVFERIPTDLEPLEHVPSGRGLDSWKLFVDHPELAELADQLVAIAQRESCDFDLVEQLEPSTEHHQPYVRAKNLLLHRVITKLRGDRTLQPDDLGNMPEPVGIDPDAARRYAIAMLNMAVHFSERGTLAERRIAANAAPDLMGIARRTPQGLPWVMDTIRDSRYLEPLENLLGYQAAAIARLQLLADTITHEPQRYIEAFGLTPSDGNTSSPQFAATLERHRSAYAQAAETLSEAWDTENPLPEVLAILRIVPADLTVPRATINEITRAVSELAGVRQDVRVMLEAYPPMPRDQTEIEKHEADTTPPRGR